MKRTLDGSMAKWDVAQRRAGALAERRAIRRAIRKYFGLSSSVYFGRALLAALGRDAKRRDRG